MSLSPVGRVQEVNAEAPFLSSRKNSDVVCSAGKHDVTLSGKQAAAAEKMATKKKRTSNVENDSWVVIAAGQ